MSPDELPPDLAKRLKEAEAERALRSEAFGQVQEIGRTLYYTDEKPILRESSVAFLDLLGTTERLAALADIDLAKLIRSARYGVSYAPWIRQSIAEYKQPSCQARPARQTGHAVTVI
jgi:hypothetical protein